MYAHARGKDEDVLRAEGTECLTECVVDFGGRGGWEGDLDYGYVEGVCGWVEDYVQVEICWLAGTKVWRSVLLCHYLDTRKRAAEESRDTYRL